MLGAYFFFFFSDIINLFKKKLYKNEEFLNSMKGHCWPTWNWSLPSFIGLFMRGQYSVYCMVKLAWS